MDLDGKLDAGELFGGMFGLFTIASTEVTACGQQLAATSESFRCELGMYLLTAEGL